MSFVLSDENRLNHIHLLHGEAISSKCLPYQLARDHDPKVCNHLQLNIFEVDVRSFLDASNYVLNVYLSSFSWRNARKTHCLFIHCEETRSPGPLPRMFRLHTPSRLPASPDAVDLLAAYGCESFNLRYRVEVAQCQHGVLEICRDLLAPHDGG